MKKQIYLTVCMMMVMTTILFAQTDTISGWNFSDTTNASMNANMGLTGNLGYNIRPEDTAGAVRTAYYMAAGIDYAAAAQGWDNGADNKFWSVRFKADGYESFRISSVQSSDPGNPGPKYWKVQARKSGGVWADVVGSNVTVGADWTTGVIQSLPLPAVLDNPGSSSCFVRWIMDSNEATDGNPVAANGVSMIDDILITGVAITGVEKVLFDSRFSIFPNPAANSVSVTAATPMTMVQILDAAGHVVVSQNAEAAASVTLDTQHLAAGAYLIQIRYLDTNFVAHKKLIISK